VGSRTLTDRALARVIERRAEYGVAGLWSAEPHDLLAAAALRSPAAVALADRSGRLTFAELDAAVDRAVGGLVARGVAVGDPVLVVVENDGDSVVAIHAALRVGALTMVAPLSAGRAQLADITAHTTPTLAVGPEPLVGSGGAAGAPWCSARSLGEGDPGLAVRSDRPADEPSLVIFTSGTTSRPKGVVHSISTLQVASRNYIDCAELTSEDRLFVVSPLASVTGILQAITVTPLIDAQVILESKWDPATTCDLLLETKGTFFGGPDLLLDKLLDEVEARGLTETTIGAVYLGGTMLDQRILDRAEREFGIVVMRAYGSSEAPISTAGARGAPREDRLADDGAPLAHVQVRSGSAADPTECCIRGPHLFLGYVHDDDDAHAFEDDWFCTGDVADLTGGRVKIVGRIRDIVIRKGMKVPISEVEGFFNALPGVLRSAGYSVPDPDTGERLAMAVLLEDGAAADALGDLTSVGASLVAAGLAKWKLPEELVIWDEDFPQNASGKVVRTDLADAAADRPRVLAPRLQEGTS
jgi:acyl-CoA synthetase (AMP-forming)/AMP-acid ligase II